VAVIDDGDYQACVVDAEEGVDDDGHELIHLSVTILNGAYKGEVVEMTAARLGRTSIDVMGMPATLVVADGRPRLTIDD